MVKCMCVSVCMQSTGCTTLMFINTVHAYIYTTGSLYFIYALIS